MTKLRKVHQALKSPNEGSKTLHKHTKRACHIIQDLESLSPNKSCVHLNCAIRINPVTVELKHNSFPFNDAGLSLSSSTHLWLCFKHFVACHRHSYVITLNSCLLHIFCLPQKVNKRQAHNEKPLDMDSSNKCLAKCEFTLDGHDPMIWMVDDSAIKRDVLMPPRF